MENKAEDQVCSQHRCVCNDPENCGAMQVYKKLLWCDAYKCLHNISVKEGKHIPHHKGWVPIGDGDKWKGICGRPEIGLKFRTTFTRDGKHRIVECKFRSDKGISGHKDFTKFMDGEGRPYGGNIPDPVAPDSAFGIR